MHSVIGSGPAGVACAHALLQRGAKVMLLDAGLGLEPARACVVAQLRQTSPSLWPPEHVALLKEGMSANQKGIPLKRVFGSDFPYRESDVHFPGSFDAVGLRPSLALGGLSNVWGAAMLPYAQRDLQGWPFGAEQLSPHYGAILGLTGLSARRDLLERLFPLYARDPSALNLSRQAKNFLASLEKNHERLEAAGIHFGQARLAVHARRSEDANSPGCVYCGLCMYGCPYGYIFNSADSLNQLRQNDHLEYRPDVIVTRLRELSTGVRIEGYHRLSREPIVLEAERVYLAAGPIPTARILLRSLGAYDQPVSMKDSQYFLFPLAQLKSAGDVRREALHTLSQVFVEILDPDISPFTVHLQIYSYNDLVGQGVAAALGPLAKPLAFLARLLERRLLIAQGYLHSEHSSRITMVLRRGAAGQPDRLELKAEPNPQTAPTIRKVLRKLLRLSPRLGAVPLPPMLQVPEAGRGFHTGGAFPMRENPGPLETDTLGRPKGWQRVHVVDSSVLPSIPATTITFPVMANARRIACESAS